MVGTVCWCFRWRSHWVNLTDSSYFFEWIDINYHIRSLCFCNVIFLYLFVLWLSVFYWLLSVASTDVLISICSERIERWRRVSEELWLLHSPQDESGILWKANKFLSASNTHPWQTLCRQAMKHYGEKPRQWKFPSLLTNFRSKKRCRYTKKCHQFKLLL